MATELRKNETLETDEEKNTEEPEEQLSDSPPSINEEAENKHEFSSPWQNSDLVLIIEDQKIHVHRIILQMTSPVLCNFLKETDSNEVPLLRTNVNDFVDLLRVIYPQFKNKINSFFLTTVENIEQIYRLAEEYQIESVMEVCREHLIHVKKTSTNAMKILVTAQVCNVHEARKQCYEILKGLTVDELKNDDYFEDLDEESQRNVLLPKAERLEKCLREIQPQLVGLIDCVLYLWFSSEDKIKLMGGSPKKCPVHQQYAKASTSMQTRIKCSACRAMFAQMANQSGCMQHERLTSRMTTATRQHYYSVTGAYFNETIVNVLQEMFSLLN
ncbi:uncharacterized protein LOC116302336 [Actinia tenebrosa]|uniref:Uncharacterized protein LOC116302336 n=1 Tax=Actinia tenebrosa TaxID=6105 RepID=A0A6P8IM58_ACTTE|nr:uncharacterized protein LOC116302336 [Actinia tenebrosa]